MTSADCEPDSAAVTKISPVPYQRRVSPLAPTAVEPPSLGHQGARTAPLTGDPKHRRVRVDGREDEQPTEHAPRDLPRLQLSSPCTKRRLFLFLSPLLKHNGGGVCFHAAGRVTVPLRHHRRLNLTQRPGLDSEIPDLACRDGSSPFVKGFYCLFSEVQAQQHIRFNVMF